MRRSGPRAAQTAGDLPDNLLRGVEMAERTCSIPGCTTKHLSRGWCSLHYQRWKRFGDPERVDQPKGDVPERFWSKVAVGDPEECWLWKAGSGRKGYGRIHWGGMLAQAHRVAYELSVGPIPFGHQVDHLCRNPPCVNPNHLEAVTQRENMRRRYVADCLKARLVEASSLLDRISTTLGAVRRQGCCVNDATWQAVNADLNELDTFLQSAP